jgi:hypothetical protein
MARMEGCSQLCMARLKLGWTSGAMNPGGLFPIIICPTKLLVVSTNVGTIPFMHNTTTAAMVHGAMIGSCLDGINHIGGHPQP